MKDRTCLVCGNFFFMGDTPRYSEETPGDNVKIECSLGVWELELYDDEDTFRRKMLSAETCKKFIDFRKKRKDKVT